MFLAGTIEMGNSVDWQEEFTKSLANQENLLILNPRRDDWDSSWIQSINDPQFNEQVTWEMDHLDISDYIVMYLDPSSKSPISLLELGLQAHSGKLLVCCPEGFWRRGNVEMVCNRYDIPMFDTLEDIQRYILLVLYER